MTKSVKYIISKISATDESGIIYNIVGGDCYYSDYKMYDESYHLYDEYGVPFTTYKNLRITGEEFRKTFRILPKELILPLLKYVKQKYNIDQLYFNGDEIQCVKRKMCLINQEKKYQLLLIAKKI